jgi:muramoyltetrapeptide carboxypeptidase LdcA involved in peptidoglycan recycling
MIGRLRQRAGRKARHQQRASDGSLVSANVASLFTLAEISWCPDLSNVIVLLEESETCTVDEFRRDFYVLPAR